MAVEVLVFSAVRLAATLALLQLPPTPAQAPAPPGGRPSLLIPQRVQDIGTVVEGDRVMVQWTLENRGDADLIIEQTRPTCGCTVVKLADADKVVRPGARLELKVEFDSAGRRGMQNKSIAVYTNDPNQPTMSVEFTATVEALYDIKPGGVVNLRAVRRGESAEKFIELLPGADRKSLTLEKVELPPDAPVTFQAEPFEEGGRTGQRIRVSVRDDLALGTITADAKLTINVDGTVKERVVAIRGDVVGDLSWHPHVIDATRQASAAGATLTPVTIRSTDAMPFEILGAAAGSLFDVKVEEAAGGAKGAQYQVSPTLKAGAPAGPFAATLEIKTTSLDQPLVKVPVFGVAAAALEVDPPIVVLRQDGTPMGARRRVKLQASPTSQLEVTDMRCSNDAVSIGLNASASARYKHIRILDVTLARELPPGTYEAVLNVSTSLPQAKQVEIPVSIVVPAKKG